MLEPPADWRDSFLFFVQKTTDQNQQRQDLFLLPRREQHQNTTIAYHKF